MKVLGFRQASQLTSLIKLLFLGAFVVFLLNIYYSSGSSELFQKIRDENLTMKMFQEKLGEYVQRGLPQGQLLELPENLSEKEKAELLGLDDGITLETREIMKELNISDAGELGVPVKIPEDLRDELKNLSETLKETYGYNAFASSMVSLNRALPDKRHEYCKNMTYPKELPKASVVIPFHDDDWMLLMRCVHSVLLRTPDHLLQEVLLVYDLSDREYYQEPLDKYIEKYPKIRLIRSHTRQGIIQNRILGGRNAKGPVIVYVDSHVEVTPGWMEPLLARIAEQPNVIAWAKTNAINTEVSLVKFGKSFGF